MTTPEIWTITPAGTWTAVMRTAMEADLRASIDWNRTLDGAYTVGAGELGFRVDQMVADGLSAAMVNTASPAFVVTLARERRLDPRPATYSRYTVRVPTGSAGELVQGTEVQGGGPLGRSRWEVVDATAVVGAGDLVVVEALDPGPVTLSGVTALGMVTPVAGITGLTYDPDDEDTFQVGRVAESIPELRVRLLSAVAGGSLEAIAARVRNLFWVVGADVRTVGAGLVQVTVAPGPAGADQGAELAEAMYRPLAGGAELSGTSSVTLASNVNRQPQVLPYRPGSTQTVTVAATLRLDGTVLQADVDDAATAAVRAVFAALSTGQEVQWADIFAALKVPGVRGITLLVNGGTADAVSPTNIADVLIPSIALAFA